MTDIADANGEAPTRVVADEDNLTVAVCERMAIVLAKAAAGSPLRAHRAAWLADMDEWKRAAMDLEASGDEGYVAFAGSVVPGQFVDFGERGWLRVSRHTATGLQLDDPMDPRPVWLNLRGPTSPLVVHK